MIPKKKNYKTIWHDRLTKIAKKLKVCFKNGYIKKNKK